MLQALKLAKQGRYTVSPNPMVGCLIVKNEQIIGQGFHLKAGSAHAEIMALQQAGSNAQDATVYVTLEPCCHYGYTPPCTKALIQARIKKVVIACLDPNPIVAGKGLAELESAGIEVELGVIEDEAKQLNEIFFHYIQYKRPFVIAKWAMSLDGKTITHPFDSRQISSQKSQQHTHQTRRCVDAILIGASTARKDNPLLTVRYKTNKFFTDVKTPIRIILSRSAQLPIDLRLFQSASSNEKVIICTTDNHLETSLHKLQKNGIEILKLPHNKENKIDLKLLLDELGKQGVTSLLVEGGMNLLHEFFNENLINKFQVYISPVIIGELEKKQTLSQVQCTSISNDLYISAYNNNNMNKKDKGSNNV